MAPLDKFVEGLSKASVARPDSDSAKGIGEKMHSIDEYKNATAATPHAEARPVASAADRVNTAAHYGDRGGEQRIDVSDMVKDLPSHHSGTPYVDHTGPAMLEKGEAVIRKEDNPMHKMNLAAELGTPADKIPSKKLKHIVTRKAGKGHIHEHHYTAPEHHKATEHATQGNAAMVQHMMDNMAHPEPDADDAAAGAAPAAPAGQ